MSRALRLLALAIPFSIAALGCGSSDPTGSPLADGPAATADGGTGPGTPIVHTDASAPKDAGRTLGPPQPAGGVLLDAYGGLHPFGGVKLNTANAPAWPNWDIARSLVVLPDGSGGWVLDGFGGIHNFGNAPAIQTPTYTKDKDIARALAVLPDMASGYVLDDFGNLHNFGPNAPPLATGATWTWDIARGFDLHVDASGKPDGGWLLDGWGGMHKFGAAADLGAGPPYFANYDLWHKLHVVKGGAYVIGRWGLIEPIGSPTGVPLANIPDFKNQDIVRDIVPVNPAGAWDASRQLVCPTNGGYCGADGMPGSTSVLYDCSAKGAVPSAKVCDKGCNVQPSGTSDFCNGNLSCANVQWWNSALTYGPYMSYGWWDTDLAVGSSSKVQLRHDSKLTKTGVYGWGYMPEFIDQVTGENFRFLHLRPQDQYATSVGTVYPAGTVVGLSGGDTADTGLGVYSTGAHLCVQTLNTYRACFPTGQDPCQ